jgi:conjugal transfer pilus assembly protein TraV
MRTKHFFRINCIFYMCLTLLTGCGSLTGLDASDSFSCELKSSPSCQSLKETYQESLISAISPTEDQALPAPETQNAKSEALSQSSSEPSVSDTERKVYPHRQPRRLAEVIVSVWIAPWTDQDGDFHEGEKIHARVRDARWAGAQRREDIAQQSKPVVLLPFEETQLDESVGASVDLSREGADKQ